MNRTVIRSLLSFLIALCLLLGPPRTGALSSARVGDDQEERGPTDAKDTSKDGDDSKEAKDAKDGQDAKGGEARTALSSAFSLPRRLPGSAQRASGTVSPLPPPPASLHHATAPPPPTRLPIDRLPRRLT